MKKIRRFLDTLHNEKNIPAAFDERLWRETVEAMVVHTPDHITVRFYSGTEISVSAKQNSVR